MRNDVVRNIYVWGALLLCGALLAAAVYVPPLARVLDVEMPDARSWALILTFSLVPWAIGQIQLQIRALLDKRVQHKVHHAIRT